jgi:hypothetical protein
MLHLRMIVSYVYFHFLGFTKEMSYIYLYFCCYEKTDLDTNAKSKSTWK